MTIEVTTAKRLYTATLTLFFCAGYMGESLHYVWVEHERCATHGDWVHNISPAHHDDGLHKEDQHHHTNERVQASHYPLLDTNGNDHRDHCNLGDFTRDEDVIVFHLTTTDVLVATTVIVDVLGVIDLRVFPIGILHLAPKHAPPGSMA